MIKDTPGFHYPAGAAPFGELDILLPHWQRFGDVMATGAVVMPQHILNDAWSKSAWVSQIVGDETAEGWREAEDYSALPDISLTVIDAFHDANQVLACAVAPSELTDKIFPNILKYALPSQFVGFGNAKLDVSGNAAERLYKRVMHPEKIYGCISNVAVAPARQGENIGAAIFDGLLGVLPEDKKATIYVARHNFGLIKKLGQLGYRETGSQLRTDLIRDAVLEEVRLEAPAVGEVRDNLRQKLSWLGAAEQI